MANRIKIRHGSSIPTTSSLLPYELGWNTANKVLYINDNGAIKSAASTVSDLLTIGLRETSTSPSSETSINRIAITPYYHTGGPWYIKSMDDSTNAYLALYYGSSQLLKIKHNGVFSTTIQANITGSAGSANALNFVHTNELLLGNSNANSSVWINYRRVSGGATSGNTAITQYHFGNSNGGTTGVTLYADSFSGNAATATKASGLVDGSSTMTSAYNKAGLDYGNYSCLAGWNGYELRAVAKTQFAQASHTHSYLPLSGGTVTGTLTVGVSKATSSSDHALWTTGITVHDTRYDTIAVNSLSKAANFFFTMTGMPDSNWWAGIHVAGWTGDYNAWELVGPAHNTDQRTKNLYIRVGRTSTGWGSWRALVTSSDTTSRRIFVTTSASVPSGAVNGDIVLVKAS